MNIKGFPKGLTVLFVLVLLFSITTVSLAAAPINASGEKLDVLVGFHGTPNPGLVRAFGGEIYAQFTIVDVIAARMTAQQATALQKNPAISYIEPDAQVHAIGQTVPWGIDRVFGSESYSFPSWGKTTGAGVGVAVLDTGIDISHPDLHVVGGRRFYVQGVFLREDDQYNDGNGHGTHVAGTIAALDNDLGVVGIAPAVDLYAVKVLTDNGSGSVSAIVAGIQWTMKQPNIAIINMSLGSSSYSKTFEDACNAAYDDGLLVVASAGNSGNEAGTGDTVGYPAKYASVIAVAASNNLDQRAYFSSTGPAVELIAPGQNIESTIPGGYATYSGTSMASPHVVGVAALVWAADPNLTNADVRTILQETAEDLKLSIYHQGYGLVRADLALGGTGGDPDDPPVTYTLTVNGYPSAGGSVTGGGDYAADAQVSLTATAATGYTFVNWTQGETIVSEEANWTYTMPGSDTTLTANFQPLPEPEGLVLTLATDKSEYIWNSWVYITVTVKDGNGTGVSGVNVTTTVQYPEGNTVGTFNGVTTTDGTVVFSYRVANKAPTGVYLVVASTSSVQTSTTFIVKKR